MEQDRLEVVEKRIAEDRGKYFRGTARLRFDRLQFERTARDIGDLATSEDATGNSNATGDPYENEIIVEFLKGQFESQGCQRLNPANHIPAVISQQTLEILIENSPGVSGGLLLENFKSPPELHCPQNVKIKCLQGRHRVAAGRKILPPRDWWWPIDLYLKGKPFSVPDIITQE